MPASNPPPSAPNPRKSVAKSKHGGPRPNSGPPKGNLNALKHGRRSKQFATLGALLASNPQTREALLDLARRHDLKQQSAIEVAHEWFAALLRHAHDIAAGVPSPGPFQHMAQDSSRSNVQPTTRVRRSTKKTEARKAHRPHTEAGKTENHPPHNQDPRTNPKNHQPPNTK